MLKQDAYRLSDTLSHLLKDERVTEIDRTKVLMTIDQGKDDYNKLRKDHNPATAAYNFALAAEQEFEKNIVNSHKGTGRPIDPSCKKGCSFCCHYYVEVTDDEAEMM